MKLFRRRPRVDDLSQIPVDQLIFNPVDIPVTQEDLKWDRKAEEARFNSLAAVQQSAERWGATILVITGLLTALTAVKGPSDLAALRDEPFRILVGALSALALIVALASVVFAARAAQGQAVKIHPTGDQFRRETLTGTKRAHSRLKLSRFLALFVIPLYLSSIGVLAYAPQADDKPPQISVTDRHGIRFCGAAAKIVNGYWILTNDDGTAGRVKVSDVASVSSVEDCQAKKKAAP